MMDWEDIKAEIRRRGSTLSQLAKENGYSPAVFSLVKNRPHKKAEKAIAAYIGKNPEILWPKRYAQKPRLITNAYKAILKAKAANKVNVA